MIMNQAILRAMSPEIYDQIQPFRATESQMPLAYQNIPGGRPLHNDWFFCQETPRIETAYRVPLPFKQIYGDNAPQWMLWDPSYPQSPGLITELRPYTTQWGTTNRLQALVDCAVEGTGYAQFAVFLNGKWQLCFTSYRRVILGRLYAQYSGGLKQDLTVSPNEDGSVTSDLMGWFDPPSFSYNAIATS